MKHLGTRRSRWHDVSAVPSWLLTRFFLRTYLPASHPWHDRPASSPGTGRARRFTLEEWTRRRTILICQLDLIFAVMFWMLVSSAVTLLVNR